MRVIQTTGRRRHRHGVGEGQTIRFTESGVRPMGRATGRCARACGSREGDAVVGCDVARRGAVMLFVSSSGHGKRTKLDLFKRRTGAGRAFAA